MKRSEMLKLIENLLQAGLDLDYETRAENLLCHLEEVGMLPPAANILLVNYYKDGESFTRVCNQWEAE